GAFGFLTDDPVKQGSYFGEDAEIYGAEPNTTILTINEGKQRGVAVFGQANIALHNKLDLTVGLRYDWEKSKITGKSKMLKGENGESAVINPDTTGEGSYRALSPEAILSYQMTPEHLLFVSFKRGFRAGGISEVSEDPSNPPLKTFGPEYSNNIELGLKNDFLNNRIRWNLSFFYTRVNELQVSQLILPEALTVTKNVGKLRSFGLEPEFTALLGRYFSVNWNAGYTNAEFTELAKAGEEGGNEDLSGNKQLFSPEFTSNARLRYERGLGDTKTFKLKASAEWQWTGTTYYDLGNTLKQDPYHLFNARIGVQRGPVELSLWTRNIFDTHYVDYAYNFGAAHLGAPATYGASIKYAFD